MGYGILYYNTLRYYVIFVLVSLLFHFGVFFSFDLFNIFHQKALITSYFYLLTSICIGMFTNYFKFNFLIKEYELRKSLEDEQKKSENLLENIFPKNIMIELKATNYVSPKYHNETTVLFIDFEHFTISCEKMSASEIIYYLNEYFIFFDKIVEQYKLEKIKTIGDGYLAVSGLSSNSENHAINALNACWEIRSFVIQNWNIKKLPWRCRIGLHSGPLISGVIGKLKYAYDIFGDTVNIASRMEKYGIPNEINISETTKELIKNFFDYKYNATLKFPNQRLIKMYFILGKKQ